jgi:[glutamine synthetase] adenylyltransferase / [glutamine synthetase]-adenylyl-L-tyrosine phosphorylase
VSEPQFTTPEAVQSLETFRQPERACRDIRQIQERLPEAALRTLLALLAEAPDPDQALGLFERLTAQLDSRLFELLKKNHVLLHYVVAIFGHSFWLGEALLHNADLLEELDTEKHLERSLEGEDYRRRLTQFQKRKPENDVSCLLARFKKREYVRIALRDVLGAATLGDTTAEISSLADVIIQEALQQAELETDDPGRPGTSGFAVLALGKLGGNELNYSSDIDLFYIYDGEAFSDAARGREDSIRLAQAITGILSSTTTEGAVFRLDLRLRPEGNEGETTVALRHALDYYRRVAQDWELQALIKARHVAGDSAVAQAFIDGVREQVYTENLNFAAIETALRSRQKMDARRRRALRGGMPDVKRDRGGVRDVEFLVQCLQRVYGGREPWLRSGGTLSSLQKLHDKDHLGGRDFHELSRAYGFLRRLEHRLQLQRGAQMHRLPQSEEELEVLSRAVGDRGETGWRPLLPAVESWMAKVSRIYDRVIHTEKGEGGRSSSLNPAAAPKPGGPISFDQLVERAGADPRAVAGMLAKIDLTQYGRRALQRFFSSASTSPEAYSSLLEDPQSLRQVLMIVANSEYLMEILVRHPEAARGLETRPTTVAQADEFHPGDGLGGAMSLLRREFRSSMFALGARDILAPRPALDSMREASALADATILRALSAVGGEQTLGVFALGRLGTEEFDIASDADLLFVRDPAGDAEHARATAEKLVDSLSAYTRDGTVFAVDARLRPHGGEGELVVTPEQLDAYLVAEAQAWEALTYSKMRFVAGKRELAPELLSSVRRRIVEVRSQPGFAQAVLGMRARLEKSNRYARSFKLARGGFYDVDFIASFLMLTHGSIQDGNTLDRLEYLGRNGLLEPPEFRTLARATLLYRTADHVIRLVTGRARPELPEAEHARAAMEALVNRILSRPPAHDLQAELEETQIRIRSIFEQLIRA